MSIYPKFMWYLEIPTGGYDFKTNLGAAVTVDAGDYTAHELGEELEDKLTAAALGVNWTVEISSIGICTVSADGAWTIDWANTDDALSTLLGYDESEIVVSNDLVATGQHTHGYYPGLISWGYTTHKGTGVVDARFFEPDYAIIRQIAGSNAQTTVGPATPSESMTLNFGQITVEEATEATYGLRAFMDACSTDEFLFYPDRDLGIVGDIGTQDTDYYLGTFIDGGVPRLRRSRNPNFVTWSMAFNREP